MSTAFDLLKKNAGNNPNWETLNFALGDIEEEAEIKIAGNSYSSSLLDMLPTHLKSAPESKYIATETIKVKTLDSIFGGLCDPKDNVYMKIDTQGFESKVLKGAEQSLLGINTIQIEMSLVPLYSGELLFNELYELIAAKGYKLVGLEPGFADASSGQLLQVDGVFHRFDSI